MKEEYCNWYDRIKMHPEAKCRNDAEDYPVLSGIVPVLPLHKNYGKGEYEKDGRIGIGFLRVKYMEWREGEECST